MKKSKWDLFISHAGEDKDKIVKPLAEALSNFGVKVWYDEFTLEIGDSLSRSIDKGLADSNYGVVVLSKAFFQKNWPEYELRGLVAKEMDQEKVILPVWHGITRKEVLNYSPPLADKLALETKNLDPVSIALKIIEIVRPDILTKIHKRAAYLKTLESAKKKKIKTKDLVLSPHRHKKLSKELIRRIRLIRAALLIVYPHSMDYWIDGFKRDSHPSQEVSWWEHLSSSFLEYMLITRSDEKQREAAFNIMMGLLNGADKKTLKKDIQKLPDGEFEKIKDICMHELPVYEIEDTTFGEGMQMASAEDLEKFKEMDEYMDKEDYSSEE